MEFNEDCNLSLKFIHSGTITSLHQELPPVQVYSSTESEPGQSSESESNSNDAGLDFSSSASDRKYDSSESSSESDDLEVNDAESDSLVGSAPNGDSN